MQGQRSDIEDDEVPPLRPRDYDWDLNSGDESDEEAESDGDFFEPTGDSQASEREQVNPGAEEIIVEDVESDNNDNAVETMEDLQQPTMKAGRPVTGATKQRHRIENKRGCKAQQAEQTEFSY